MDGKFLAGDADNKVQATGRYRRQSLSGFHYYATGVIDRVPARFISLPYKQYWLREENRARAKRMLSQMMDEFGLSLFGFLFMVSLLAIHANRAVPVRLNEPLFLVLLAAFLLYTLLWTIRLFLRFRPSNGV